MRGTADLLAAGVVGTCLGGCIVATSTLPSPWQPLILLVAACPFLVMITGNLRKLLLAAALLDIPLQLGVHPGYRVEVAELGGLGGWDLSVTTLALGGLYALWAIELLGRTGARAHPDWRSSLPAGAYVACVAVSLVVARDATLASFQVALLAQVFLLYLYIVSRIRTRDEIAFVVTLLLAGLLGEALLMIGLRLAGESVSLPGVVGRLSVSDVARGQEFRVGGTIGSANAAAIYLSLLLALAVTVLLTPLGRWRKRLALLALAFGAGALITTLARGGWVAFAVSTAIVCFFAYRRGWLSARVPLVLVALVLLLALAFHDTIALRLASDDQGSAYSRVPLMRLALRIIDDHPALGIGANNYVLEMQRYVTPDFSDYGGEWLYLVHNHYLLVWAETGISGLIAFLWFLLATLLTGCRAWQREDRLLAPLALGLTAAMVGQMLCMSVDLFNDRAQTQAMWVCAALLVSVRLVPEEREAAPSAATPWAHRWLGSVA
jgi:putative inorganic carbon (HCO3(-)) transporter